MKSVGGIASFNGITFYSKTDMVKAKRINGNIVITKIRKIEKNKENKISEAVRKIPFIRGIWTLMEVLLSVQKSVWIMILLLMLMLFLKRDSISNTEINIYFRALLYASIVCVIRFSSLAKYHGAEHKIINTHLKGKELTIENIKRESRISINCGTNLAIFFILINLIFLLFQIASIYTLILSWTLAYELFIVKEKIVLFKPFILVGGLLQKYLFTAEPNDKQIEIGIVALQEILKESESK